MKLTIDTENFTLAEATDLLVTTFGRDKIAKELIPYYLLQEVHSYDLPDIAGDAIVCINGTRDLEQIAKVLNQCIRAEAEKEIEKYNERYNL